MLTLPDAGIDLSFFSLLSWMRYYSKEISISSVSSSIESTKAELSFDVRFFNTYFYFLLTMPSLSASDFPFIIWADVIARIFVYSFQLVKIEIRFFSFVFSLIYP